MKKDDSRIKRRYQSFMKNMRALKQANITPVQMVNLMKEWDTWWKITVNLREIEGSWTRAMQKYVSLFRGVPRKSMQQSQDNAANNSFDKL
jgi:hypothetical protein